MGMTSVEDMISRITGQSWVAHGGLTSFVYTGCENGHDQRPPVGCTMWGTPPDSQPGLPHVGDSKNRGMDLED